MFLAKKWGILIKKESESLIFTDLKIPRDYKYNKEGNTMRIRMKSVMIISVGLMIVILTMKEQEVEATTVLINNFKWKAVVEGYCFKMGIKGYIGEIGWSSSDESVVAVNEKGEVNAKKIGTAIITAKTQKKKYTCRVEVFANHRDSTQNDRKSNIPREVVPDGAKATASKVWGKKNIGMEILDVTNKKIKLKLINQGNKYYLYTPVFTLKRYQNGKWKRVRFKKSFPFSKAFYVLRINGSDLQQVKWKQYFRKNLSNGKYMIGWKNMRGEVFKSKTFIIR